MILERYKDFTINQETFPNFRDFTAEMKEHGVHPVPIIDAGEKQGAFPRCAEFESKSIMIAPVYTQSAKGRYVYLPEDILMVRMKSLEERASEIIEKGHSYIDMDLDEVVIFVRRNHMLPLAILDEDVL